MPVKEILSLYGQGRPQKTSLLPAVKILSDEWAVLKFLGKWKPEDLRYAIENDVRLAPLLEEHSGDFIVRIIKSAAGHSSGLSQFLSPENVLQWLGERRPDLYAEAVQTDAGVRWIVSNFSEIRGFLNI